jgi:hypothetical protein
VNKSLKIVIFGFLLWLIPFIISFIIYPLKIGGSPLFESIMPIVITIMVVLLTYFYLITIETDFIKEGIKIGIIWFIINVIIDLFIFLPPNVMHMSFSNYMADIGITYLIIPTITIGMGIVAANKSNGEKID